jgi:hypothetical protein
VRALCLCLGTWSSSAIEGLNFRVESFFSTGVLQNSYAECRAGHSDVQLGHVEFMYRLDRVVRRWGTKEQTLNACRRALLILPKRSSIGAEVCGTGPVNLHEITN